MPKEKKRNEQSSKTLASLASEALLDPRASAREKSLAGSVLTQAPDNPDKERGEMKEKKKHKKHKKRE